jgi:alkylation response protein AidB-like acyl-CoA dehydrogenase
MRYPEEAGGSGTQPSEFCLALEEIARGFDELLEALGFAFMGACR